MQETTDLSAQVPPRLQQLLEPGEHVMLVIPGFPRTIVATDRRVIVGQSSPSPATTRTFRFEELTGVAASLGILSRRQIVLEGPGLRSGFLASSRDGNSTVVQIWKLSQARIAVDRLRALIAERNSQPQIAKTSESP